MFDPVIHLAVVVSPGLLLLLSVALAVLLMAMLFGLIEANVILRSAAWVTITFVVCGLVTALVGLLLFGFLYAFGKEAVLLQLCIVLTSVGVLAIAIPFLPEAWLVGEAAAEPRSRMAFRFLLGFALVGFLVGLPVAIAPPITFQSIRAALFWICPGAIPGTMFGGGSFAAVVLTGLFNGIFFGAFGSIIGIVASLLRVPKKPTAVAIAAALVLSIPGRAFSQEASGRANNCDAFMAAVAGEFRDAEVCRNIPLAAVRPDGSNLGSGFRIISMRSTCFLSVAIEKHDPSLCSEVKPIPGSAEDGSAMNESFCQEKIKGHLDAWIPGGVLYSGQVLASIMQQMGYNNQQLTDAKIDPQDNSAWVKYIQFLRNTRSNSPDAAQRQLLTLDFLKRVKDLNCNAQ